MVIPAKQPEELEQQVTETKPTICTFESRRSEEMRSLIERFGGIALVAPSMQEVPVEQNVTAIDAITQIVEGSASSLVLLTGVGTESMLKVAASASLEDKLLKTMKRIPLLVRGPKPAAVLNKLGMKYTVKAPEPNTWRELLQAIADADIQLQGQTVAVQEYGISNPEFYEALQQVGATVLPVPVYRWALPDNVEPLKTAIQKTIADEIDCLMFTSAQQVRHTLQVAEESGQRNEWLAATANLLVASIGPTCTETLVEEGLKVSFEASPPKMGPLVRGAMECLT